MEQIDMTHVDLALDTTQVWPVVGRKPALTLVPERVKEAPAANPAQQAAEARIHSIMARSASSFLDREGFVETFGQPTEHMADRTCWTSRSSGLPSLSAHMADAAGLDGLIDLGERLLARLLQDVVAACRADLRLLGVDVDMLKYLRLPLRRVMLSDALEMVGSAGGKLSRWQEEELLQICCEPVLLVAEGSYRLLLPGVGYAGSAAADGRFTIELEQVARFALARRYHILARPGLA